MNAWHNLSITEAASLLDTDVEQGLSGNEAKQRLARYGPNKLRKGKRFSALVIFASQFRSLVIWVLIGAAAVSAALGETVDGIAIIALLAHDALRVLAVAERALDNFSFEAGMAVNDTEIEQGLTLLGLVGLQDPPRGEAKEAVAKCKRAGIKTVMITGDHPDTAWAIGHELGILGKGDEVLVGAELDRLDDEALKERVAQISVYARVTAEHKLRIVRAWKARGTVVAMTGDGG